MEASAAGAIFFSDDGKKRVVLLWFWTGQLELGTGRRGTGVRRRPRAGARAERFRRALVLHIRYTSGGLTSSGSGLGASTRAVARAGGRARASRRGVEERGANDEEYGSLGQVCTGTSRDEGDRDRDRDAIGR